LKRVGVPIAIVLLVTLSCVCIPLAPQPVGEPETDQKGDWRCSPVPDAFQESDLVGTWQAWYFPRAVTDTLTLREDGAYRQVYEDDLANYYYTSPWNRWYVEHRSTGTLYLHLEGMRYCLGTDEICRRDGGGGGTHPYHDPCESITIRNMGNEVILVVQGSEGFRYPGIESVPQGILLWHMKFNPEGTDSFFILQESLGR
jgi:hypothetical protein